MSELLLLFVWTHTIPWSIELAKIAKKDAPKVALRSICADSIEARGILANTTPRIVGVPVLIVIEHKDGKKTITTTYIKDEIVRLVEVINTGGV